MCRTRFEFFGRHAIDGVIQRQVENDNDDGIDVNFLILDELIPKDVSRAYFLTCCMIALVAITVYYAYVIIDGISIT
jgi:hypothetical protein